MVVIVRGSLSVTGQVNKLVQVITLRETLLLVTVPSRRVVRLRQNLMYSQDILLVKRQKVLITSILVTKQDRIQVLNLLSLMGKLVMPVLFHSRMVVNYPMILMLTEYMVLQITIPIYKVVIGQLLLLTLVILEPLTMLLLVTYHLTLVLVLMLIQQN